MSVQIAKPETYISNSYGVAYKLAGGLLIQRASAKVPAGSTYVTVNFPEVFVGGYSVVVANVFSYSRNVLWSVANKLAGSVDVYTYGSDGVEKDAELIAIGCWK